MLLRDVKLLAKDHVIFSLGTCICDFKTSAISTILCTLVLYFFERGIGNFRA